MPRSWRRSPGAVPGDGADGTRKEHTLAALVDEINRTRSDQYRHDEDPIHRPQNCVVHQREVGLTPPAAEALKHVLRQTLTYPHRRAARPETIQAAITAAETTPRAKHAASLQDASQSVDRLIDVFPPHRQ